MRLGGLPQAVKNIHQEMGIVTISGKCSHFLRLFTGSRFQLRMEGK
jgi:hypothetical protein